MKKLIMFIVCIAIMLTGCELEPDTVDTPLYSGKGLNLAVIGNPPKVRERHVSFTTITFDDLEQGAKLASKYDAVLIMKEHFPEADKSQYAEIYKGAGIPFFFIESRKSYVPFIIEDLAYEDVPDISPDYYATGFLQSGENIQFWGYGLYNDKVNEPNIKDAYSRIFTTIESIGNSK